MFVENAQKQTPCDSAEKSGHNHIALYLESKMVFSVCLQFNFCCYFEQFLTQQSVKVHHT